MPHLNNGQTAAAPPRRPRRTAAEPQSTTAQQQPSRNPPEAGDNKANTENNKQNDYFNLQVRGIGYLNRVREVKPKKGDPFFACDIKALHGKSGAPNYTRFSVRISGATAKSVCKDLMADSNNRDSKVLIGFTIGDIEPESYTYNGKDDSGNAVEKLGMVIRGRLLFIKWARVNGETVHKAAETNEVAESSDSVPF